MKLFTLVGSMQNCSKESAMNPLRSRRMGKWPGTSSKDDIMAHSKKR